MANMMSPKKLMTHAMVQLSVLTGRLAADSIASQHDKESLAKIYETMAEELQLKARQVRE